MLVVGLTGSIGMGKSTIAARLRHLGIAGFDADAEVHRLYDGPAVGTIERAFPGTTHDGRVDRAMLAQALRQDSGGFERLEAIVHPLVRASEAEFLRSRALAGDVLAVLEVPLLYETGLETLLDAVIVVSAPAEVQRRRVLERPGMTAAKLDSLLARQMSDAEKRRRADFVVDTSGTLAQSEHQIDAIVETLRRRRGRAFDSHWKPN
ncbi:MAG: dephospho-CoA kinase [Hyphomicrobium sp.]